VHPILISFVFPEFLSRISLVEIGLTAVAIAGLFLWLRTRERFSLRGFGFWVAVYALARYLAWYAGPGYEFKLHTYGVLIAVGFVLGIWLAMRQAHREGLDPGIILDLSFWILIAAMVGSRVLFIIVNIQDYIADPLALIKIWQGGLVFYGGFIGAVLASWYYCRRHGIDFFRIADIMIPSVALGHVLGRLGCFTAGCCHGMPTGSDWFGAIFHDHGTVVARNHLLGTPIHPTQLYDAAVELSIFVFLILWRGRKRVHGELLALWLMFYGLGRFVVEMFRGDTERGMLLRIDLFGNPKYPQLLSTSQIVALGLFAFGLGLLLLLRKRPRQAPVERPDESKTQEPAAVSARDSQPPPSFPA